ncbi:MAG: hypothetical protein H0W65_02075 [Sphingomonas sp.]|uniref:hypothetical protein n=1 Tax=Sphingomonas sp. TaxID=28214 RepID=UPI00179A13B7|nr:hypothetical protein [Sphingomonas sp.]MBA3666496.1 hypothetical protein [Sphingomonas sp.]
MLMGVFSILFLAALLGLIKPYIARLNRKHFSAIAGAAFVGMMIVVPKDESAKETGSINNLAASAGETPGETKINSASKWEYSDSKDAMRDATTRFASLRSENQVDLDFPYGEQYGTIIVRDGPDGLDVMFSVDKGQILCHSFTEASVSFKFDAGPIQKFRCTDASDGSSETAFLTDPKRALAALKTSKRVIVEAEFFQRGNQQFTFETANLAWK